VAGAEYSYGETFFVQVSGFANAVLRPPSHYRLVGFEDLEAPPEERDLAVGYGLGGTLRSKPGDSDLELAVSGIWAIVPGDWVVVPEIRYTVHEPHTLVLGAFLLDGERGGLLRQYGGADFVYFAYRGAFG
jgi:hypothetical protein